MRKYFIAIFAIILLSQKAFSNEILDFFDYQYYSIAEYDFFAQNREVKFYVLKFDPKKVIIEIVSGNKSNKFSRQSLEDYLEQNNAFAAINGTFFHKNGTHASYLKDSTGWISTINSFKSAISISRAGSIAFDRIKVNPVLSGENFKHSIKVDYLNQNLKKNKTQLVCDKNILAEDKGLYKEGILIKPNGKTSILPLNDFENGDGCLLIGNLDLKKIPNKYNISYNYKCKYSDCKSFQDAKYVISGSPLLIKNKKKFDNFSKLGLSEKFVDAHEQRTALGKLSNGDIVVVVAVSNSILSIDGVTLYEMRDFMYDIGCTDAINLDGGLSSNLLVKDDNGELIVDLTGNNFSIERMISSAIVLKKK